MTTSRGARRQWWMVLGGLAVAVATSGCSAMIAGSGVSGVSELYRPQTRAEVHAAFGDTDETRTCTDGRLVEYRRIRQQQRWGCKEGDAICVQKATVEYTLFWLRTFGLGELVALPAAAIQSEQAKLHYAFVYGEDDRVLYRYDVKADPATRYEQARTRMAYRLLTRLNQGECPAWGTCLRTYVEEARQRAACVEYTLTPRDEEILQRVQALAADLEMGRLSPENARADLQPCLWGRGFPDACVPPALSRSDPNPARAPEVLAAPHPAQDVEPPMQPSPRNAACPTCE